MRFLIKIFFALVLLVVIGFAAIAFLVPTDLVRDQAIALVKERTGRDLRVGGETSFAFYPNIGVTLGDVSLSNPAGMAQGTIVRMAALTLDLKLLPLLARSVEIDTFILRRPVFDLRIDRAGRANWTFDRLAMRSGAARPLAASGSARGLWSELGITPAHAQGTLQDLRLGEVRIENGLLHFTDERSGAQHRVEALNVALAMPRLSDPVDAKGSLVWRGEAVEFLGQVASVPALMRNDASPVSLTVSSQPVTGAFEGSLAFSQAVALDGDLRAQSPSLRSLLHWVGAPAPRQGGGPGALAGRLRAGADAITFSQARLSLDSMTGQGDVAIHLSGARPLLRASLSLDQLDLGAYEGGFDAAPAQPQPRIRPAPAAAPRVPVTREPLPAPAAAPKPAPRPEPDQSLTDFIEQLNRSDKEDKLPVAPAPAVKAWNERAFDFEPLRGLDAEVKLAAGKILFKDIKTGRGALAATLTNGVLTADLTQLSLYGGAGTGRLTLNSAGAVPSLAIRLDLDGVSALPLLKDAAEFDWIAGRARIALDLTGAGRSQSELVRALRGSGSVVFSDGALVGINIPEMVRGLKSGRFDGWKRDERQSTDFSKLSGTFTMQGGVAVNKDLSMVGPLVRAKGEGKVDLPREWIDFDVLPRVVATLQGQGGEADAKGIPVPLKIEGPLDEPQVKPDMDRLMNDPELAQEAINQIGEAVEQLKKGDGTQVQQLLNNFLGGGQAPETEGDASGDETQQQVQPQELLKNLFGR